jgi:hypothetical protein
MVDEDPVFAFALKAWTTMLPYLFYRLWKARPVPVEAGDDCGAAAARR